MFKIGNSKELPAIPSSLSAEGRDFVLQCLQRNPLHRPTAAKLLEHPFVKNAVPLERPIPIAELSEGPPAATNSLRTLVLNLSFAALSDEVSYLQLFDLPKKRRRKKTRVKVNKFTVFVIHKTILLDLFVVVSLACQNFVLQFL